VTVTAQQLNVGGISLLLQLQVQNKTSNPFDSAYTIDVIKFQMDKFGITALDTASAISPNDLFPYPSGIGIMPLVLTRDTVAFIPSRKLGHRLSLTTRPTPLQFGRVKGPTPHFPFVFTGVVPTRPTAQGIITGSKVGQWTFESASDTQPNSITHTVIVSFLTRRIQGQRKDLLHD
jgi:hypothetical protein